MTYHRAFLGLYFMLGSTSELFHVLRRCVALLCPYLWRRGQRQLCTLQRGHLLSGWYGHAVDLSRGFLLPGR